MIRFLAKPGSAIQSVDTTQIVDSTQAVLYDMAAGLRFLNLVSESIINPNSTDKAMPWYSVDEVKAVLRDTQILDIYLGLLWQQSANIKFIGGRGKPLVSMRQILVDAAAANDFAAKLENWRNAITALSKGTNDIQLSVKAGTVDPKTFVPDQFSRYTESIYKILETVNMVGRLTMDRKPGHDLIPEDYIFYIRQGNSLYYNVRQHKYTAAIGNLIVCLSNLQQSAKDKTKITDLLKYANFAASIAEANSPDEIENAIEMFALPPGSSATKKVPGRLSVALNAYTGLAGGWEYLNGDKRSKGYASVAAPVGLSVSWGLGRHKTSANGDAQLVDFGSLGFFVPLIDVGAVTAFRFDDDAAKNLPELTWSNILAPGLYAVYDFPGNIPIAFGIGGQAGPGLRKVTASGLDIDKSGYRFGAFLSVDIPITYFFLGKGK
jgi:hypothetical protein